MWANTRSNVAERRSRERVRCGVERQASNPALARAGKRNAALSTWLLLASLATLVSPCFAFAAAPPLPAPVSALAPDARPVGGGEMRVFGFAVYDGWYWASAPDFSIARPFALDLHYHRALDGAKIAERSVEEISKLGYGTAAERSRWGEAMKAIFPSVGKGDRLTGVNLPSGGARFFHNGRPIGEVADPSFARAFFGIWLDPGTSRPDFRALLLGLAEGAR